MVLPIIFILRQKILVTKTCIIKLRFFSIEKQRQNTN